MLDLVLRGHSVMTVAPRYEEYCGIDDTGLVVPLRGREDQSRLHWCKIDGVDRVFVEHRAFGRNRTRRGISIYPYTPEVRTRPAEFLRLDMTDRMDSILKRGSMCSARQRYRLRS